MANSMVSAVMGLMVLFLMIVSSVVIMEVSGVNEQFGMEIQDPLEVAALHQAVDPDNPEDGIGVINSGSNSLFTRLADITGAEKMIAPLAALNSFFWTLSTWPGIPEWVGEVGGLKLFMQLGGGLLLLYLLTGKKL